MISALGPRFGEAFDGDFDTMKTAADALTPVGLDVLRGAVARGWCSPENAHKEMDTELAEAIVREVNDVFQCRTEKNDS